MIKKATYSLSGLDSMHNGLVNSRPIQTEERELHFKHWNSMKLTIAELLVKC